MFHLERKGTTSSHVTTVIQGSLVRICAFASLWEKRALGSSAFRRAKEGIDRPAMAIRDEF
jgi:hypothetical protein